MGISIRTRARRLPGLVVLAAGLTLFASVASATPAQEVVYEGQTEQGLPLSFTVVDTGSGLVISEMSFAFNLVCETSGDLIGAGAGFFGFNVPIEDGMFTFDYNSVFNAIHWSGRINSTRARGTVTYLIPGLTPDEQAQLCPSGLLRWGARPTGGGTTTEAPRPDSSVISTRDRSGQVTTSVRNGG